QKNGLTSEYGTLLTFSMNVQSSLTDQLVTSGTDRERRIALALQKASLINGPFKRDFETRHVQLARGQGFEHAPFIDLTRWRFDDPDPAPPPRSRILSLGLSSAPAMAALARFEHEAKAQAVVDDRVWEAAGVQDRLVAAKIPYANATRPDDRTPDL